MSSNNTLQINALVGEAIKALVDAGVSADVVGAFAISYPSKVASIMGQPSPSSELVDLERVIHDTVLTALTSAGVVNGRINKDSHVKRINVLVKGQRTSVGVTDAMFSALVELKGSPSRARTVVNELANQAPSEVQNRSAWVGDQLMGFLMLSKQGAAEDRQH